MRIIAGSAKGRALVAPAGQDTRPTGDRVKETLFNVLGQWLEGERVLDLYAGAGSLGLEALSRGGEAATFVEHSRQVMAVLEQNARKLGFFPQSRLLTTSVDKALRQLSGAGERFTLVFADPPYAKEACGRVLELLGKSGVVEPGGRVVLEHGRGESLPPSTPHFERIDERRLGDTVLSLYEAPQAG